MANASIFCAAEQARTPHQHTVDGNGEHVLTCATEGCGRFFKLPAGIGGADIRRLVEEHEWASSGHIPAEVAEAQQQTAVNDAEAAFNDAFGL